MFEVDKESTMRSYAHLTWKQRYQIEQWLEAGEAVSFIASELRIHRSTAYREKRRGRTRSTDYEARLAYLNVPGDYYAGGKIGPFAACVAFVAGTAWWRQCPARTA